MREIAKARALDLLVHPPLEDVAGIDPALEEQAPERDVLEATEVRLQQLGVDAVHRPARGDQRTHDAAGGGPRHRAEGHPHVPEGAERPDICGQANSASAKNEVDLVAVCGGGHGDAYRGGAPARRSSPERADDARIA